MVVDDRDTLRAEVDELTRKWASNLERERGVIIERDALRAERDAFYMDYRAKCDAETKAQAVTIEALRAERDQLRGDLNVARLQLAARICSECPASARVAECEGALADIGYSEMSLQVAKSKARRVYNARATESAGDVK